MQSAKSDTPNLAEAMFGLTFQPGETSELLLREERPPYVLTCFVLLLLVIFVPVATQLVKYGVTVYNKEALLSLAIILFFAVLIFVLLESVLLMLLDVSITIRQVFAVIGYCLLPFVLGMLLIYLFNYFAHGRLTIMTLLVTGTSAADDKFLRIVPFALLIIQLNMVLVFWYSIRFLGQLSSLSATAITILSLVPFYAALLAALFVGELVRSGTIAIFERILLSPSALTVFGR